MNRFIRATSNGQSQCYNCGTVSWDIFMFKDTKFNNSRVCCDCKKLIEQGKPETEIKWKNFIPKYRIENTKEMLFMNNYNRYTFKAKRKDNGEWVYGYYVSEFNKKLKINKYFILNDEEENFIEIIPETLCQCTGLQDKDGNYIFENDIVNIHNNPYHGEAVIKYGIYKTKPFKKGQTEVEHLGFYLEIGNELLPLADIFTPFKSLLESTKSIKIIGNKFDKEVE